jgi:hypothetical protein
MALSNGALGVFKISARIAQTYSPIWTRICAWHNCVDRSGVGFGVDFKHFVKSLKKCFNDVFFL